MPRQIQASGDGVGWLKLLRRMGIEAQRFITNPDGRHRPGHTKQARKAE